MYCEVCGPVIDIENEDAEATHKNTPNHKCNVILQRYKAEKKRFSRNRDGAIVLGNVAILNMEGEAPYIDNHKLRISVKPNEIVKFSFKISNEMKDQDFLIVGIQLAHPQPQFEMNDHQYVFGKDAHLLKKKSSVVEEIYVKFSTADIGQYEMPTMFTFLNCSNQRVLIIIRELVVSVEEHPIDYIKTNNPYKDVPWKKSEKFIPAVTDVQRIEEFKIPKELKTILALGLEEEALDKMKCNSDDKENYRKIMNATRSVIDDGIDENMKENYMMFFHTLLWWEEIIAKINMRKYNMLGVTLMKRGEFYVLEVPGLAEKRPSLCKGDIIILRPQGSNQVDFESIIKEIEDSNVVLEKIEYSFDDFYDAGEKFDVRFLMSRYPLEMEHKAVSKIFTSKQLVRLFPQPTKNPPLIKSIARFYNPDIQKNSEQKSAVLHILFKTSGLCPYMVYGPPGTGKTMTIVEAIIQVVVQEPSNRVLVCTDSNMAADHIALMLLKYKDVLRIKKFLMRANSQTRVWSVMPPELHKSSNGSSVETWYPVKNEEISSYRIVVTTLLHSAKYASSSQRFHEYKVSHLFIDEAAQALEPVTLVPITGLLSASGQLVLAGDPQQLGPVCISKDAKANGLGQSLMERLHREYADLYESDRNYITMLVKNFRSHPDILKIPNDLFYENALQPCAKPDPLSTTKILKEYAGGERAVLFHAVNSKEQRMGNTPSFFNEKELDMLKIYIEALLKIHNVLPKDIGVLAPYIRQVSKMKVWLKSMNYTEIEVGTVESFQGKEKRVILVSTVRANCKLLDYDAKYNLGFLVDDKRFNVTLTRAKAKLIIIGNPACLTKDEKWRNYMKLCEEHSCYFGKESQQMERTTQLLKEIAITRFDKCRLTGLKRPH